MESYADLPAYAARATWTYKLVLDDAVTTENRADVVCSDLGPEGVPIIFRRDGLVIFEFDKAKEYSGGGIPAYELDPRKGSPKHINEKREIRERLRERRYRYMNAFMSCFNSVINMSNQLPRASGPDHYIWARLELGQWRFMDNGACDLSRVPFASAIAGHQLKQAVQRFRSANPKHYELALEVLDLVYRAGYHLNNHEFQTSLILCWVVIERCQNILWGDFVAGGYKTINPNSNIAGDRKKLLLSDRNFTASIKSQILALSGVYRDDELKSLDGVRKKRNAFMHGLEIITSSDAMFARRPVDLLVEKALGVKLGLFGNPGSWDYIR